MADFAEKLKSFRDSKGYSLEDLANILGTSKQVLSRYETRKRIPKISTVNEYAEKLELPLTQLLPDAGTGSESDPIDRLTEPEKSHIIKYRNCDDRGKSAMDNVLEYEYLRSTGSSSNIMPIKEKTTLKVYEQCAAAGIGNYLQDGDSYEILEFDSSVVPKRADYGVRIGGNSMEPDIPDGCVVFIDSCPVIDPGEIGLFNLNGSGYCKKLKIDLNNGVIYLVSTNPDYEPIMVGADDHLHTYGRVLGWTEDM